MSGEAPGREYKSPLRKVLALLKTGRDNWKAKYQAVKQEVRQVKQQNRVVEASREQWKERALRAESDLKKRRSTSSELRRTDDL